MTKKFLEPAILESPYVRTSFKWNVYVKNLRCTWKYTYLYVNAQSFLIDFPTHAQYS